MIRLLAIPLMALFALALFASPAGAKSPFFKAEISGGDLAAPVMIGDVIPGGWIDSYDMDAPLSEPAHTYTVHLFDSDEQGNVGASWATFTYYPAHDGQSAALRYPDGHFGTVLLSLSQLIESHLPSAAAVAPVAEDGGTSFAWWAVPSALGLGLAVVGGGVAGLRRRKISPA